MTASLRIWFSADHHTAFRCGGWAWVRDSVGELVGLAGGARNTTAGRNSLEGLASALKGLPKDAAVELRLTDARLARMITALPQFAAASWKDAKGEPLPDQDLWLAVAAALSTRTYSAIHAEPSPRTPAAFSFAWAELARDKAKAQGPFSSAIPKPNLAKIQGL